MYLYRFQIRSHLSQQGVLERVRAVLGNAPGKSYRERPEGSPPFIGSVDGSHFECHRDVRYEAGKMPIRYSNSFLPRIRGRVDSDAGGTRIDVFMDLHPAVLVFILLYLGAAAFGAATVLIRGERDRADLTPLGFFVFGLALVAIGFYPEAIKARRILEKQIGETTA